MLLLIDGMKLGHIQQLSSSHDTKDMQAHFESLHILRDQLNKWLLRKSDVQAHHIPVLFAWSIACETYGVPDVVRVSQVVITIISSVVLVLSALSL